MDKIAKLEGFLETETFRNLDPAEQARLRRQDEAMVAYYEILRERVAAFEP